jgi:predicted acyltransferase
MATQLDMAAQVTQPAESAAVPRMASLDAFRGFIMFWIVGGTAIIQAIVDLGRNPFSDFLATQFDHSPWEGLRFFDLIWPSFMLMVGISVTFSFAKRSLTDSHRKLMLHALKRATVLFLLGSVRTSLHYGSPLWIELSSALQPIAVAYLVAALVAHKSARFQAAFGASILAGYALMLAFVATPGIAAGSYVRNANLVSAIDSALLGRAHPGGWGTILSTIPTISTTILGLLIGKLLMSERASGQKMRIIALTGACGVALGWALSPVIPMIMKLWTVSYGIASAGCACLLFLFFYWLIDVRGWRKWSFPLVVIGMNAVAIYMGRSLVPISHHISILTKGIMPYMGLLGPLFVAVAVIVVEWCILYWMYRRKIFLRA